VLAPLRGEHLASDGHALAATRTGEGERDPRQVGRLRSGDGEGVRIGYRPPQFDQPLTSEAVQIRSRCTTACTFRITVSNGGASSRSQWPKICHCTGIPTRPRKIVGLTSCL